MKAKAMRFWNGNIWAGRVLKNSFVLVFPGSEDRNRS